MITREKYLEALDIVEAYHKQLNLAVVRHCGNDNDISQLEKGDYVRFSKEVKPIPKNFTVGKSYEILDKRQDEPWKSDGLQIRHDNGGVYWIPLLNTYKRWGCA